MPKQSRANLLTAIFALEFATICGIDVTQAVNRKLKLNEERYPVTFHFMVNHLTRGNQLARRRHAEGLREWARLQELPIIAAGDYNFDFDFRNLTGNQAMSIFMRREANDGGKFVWDWIIPSVASEVEGEDDTTRRIGLIGELIDTNWDGNGTDDNFRDSLLDFVFLGQGARDWGATSTVIVRSGDFPDDEATSDHRPVEAVLDPGGMSVDVGGPRE